MKGTVLDERLLVMHADDTVGTAIADLETGDLIDEGRSITVRDDVDFGHKLALDPMDAGDPVQKYGEVIGRATAAIRPGEWVHTHNVESVRGRGDRAGEDDG